MPRAILSLLCCASLFLAHAAAELPDSGKSSSLVRDPRQLKKGQKKSKKKASFQPSTRKRRGSKRKSTPVVPESSQDDFLGGRFETPAPTLPPTLSDADSEIETSKPTRPLSPPGPLSPSSAPALTPLPTLSPTIPTLPPSLFLITQSPSELTSNLQSDNTLSPAPTTLSFPSYAPTANLTSFPSNFPTSQPSSTALTVEPTDQPSPAPTTSTITPTVNDRIDTTGSTVVVDPSDPTSFVCPQTLATREDSAATGLEIPIAFTVDFVYEVFVEPTTPFSEILPAVEVAITQAVAQVLLACGSELDEQEIRQRRRLLEGVSSISSRDEDFEVGKCGTECYRIQGALTIEANGLEADDMLVVVCSALEVVKDSSVLTRIAMSTVGVEGILFQESSIWCGSNFANGAAGGGSGENGTLGSSKSSLGTGAALSVTMAGLVLVVAALAVMRRRRGSQLDEVTGGDTNKDWYSIAQTNTGLSSPSTATMATPSSQYNRFPEGKNSGYSFLADSHSYDSELVSSSTEPLRGQTSFFDEDMSPQKDALFRVDQTELPEHWDQGFSPSKTAETYMKDDDDLMQYARPFHLSPTTQVETRHSQEDVSHRTSFGTSLGAVPMTPIQENEAVSSPSPNYPRLSSLLGVSEDSEDLSVDDDSVGILQFIDGDVRLMSSSDLAALNTSVLSEDSI